VKIALELVRNGARVTVHDPKALPNVRAQLGAAVAYAESLEEAVREADVIVIATAWDEYRKLNISLVKPGAVAIDCWRILPPEPFRQNGGYVTIGTAGDSVSAPIAAASFSTGG
jgi:UDPglucose 6-dehydrogenase